MNKELLEKVKEYIKDKNTISATQLQLEFEIGYPEAREIVDLLIKESLVKTKDNKIYIYQGETDEESNSK